MIELENDSLVFRFPEVHEDAVLRLEFERTLRIPDDGHDYPLPPGLGSFPLRHTDDFAENVPESWLQRGGVMLPMYQSEALWLSFMDFMAFDSDYPFAVKVAAGKINAVTGEPWKEKLGRSPQDYVVACCQPWLDGFCVDKGVIRQFVAMPLGSGYSAEEQLTGEAELGGIQILAYPLKAEHYDAPKPPAARSLDLGYGAPGEVTCHMYDMGLAGGGRMHQAIYQDPAPLDHWAQEHSSRCFIHLANSLVWRQITGADPPTVPPTAREYTEAGLPWFDYYADQPAVEGSSILSKLESIAAMSNAKGDTPPPENEPVSPANVVHLRKGLGKHPVREGRF